MAESNSDPPNQNSIPNSSRINPSDDSSSLYFLHPYDNPGALLVSEIFTGENYVAWSRSLSIALTVKNKIAFIDGTLSPPSSQDQTLRIAWLRANNLVLSWLMNSISKEIRGSLLYFTSAFKIWEELKIRYLRSDGPRVFTLERSLSSISQASKSVTEYFSEYISYRPFPVCHCGNLERCSCDILKNLAERQQADYVMKFLVGLHDSYSALRSQLLLQSPLPSMSKVFSLLLQEESQRSLSNTIGISLDSQAMFATQSQRQHSQNVSKIQKPRGKTDAICSHCGYSGHLVDKCFQLIGYPPGWKGPRGKRSISAYPGNEPSRLPIANNASSLEQDANNPTNIFSQEQIQNLITLANSLSNSHPVANIATISGIS